MVLAVSVKDVGTVKVFSAGSSHINNAHKMRQIQQHIELRIEIQINPENCAVQLMHLQVLLNEGIFMEHRSCF